jgi:hypothetical protein
LFATFFGGAFGMRRAYPECEVARRRAALILILMIIVKSAAVIEPRVAAMNCPHDGGTYRLLEHERAASGVRRVDVTCRQCSEARTFLFRIVEPPELN